MGLSLCVKVFIRLSKNADAAYALAEKLYASILFLSMWIAQTGASNHSGADAALPFWQVRYIV